MTKEDRIKKFQLVKKLAELRGESINSVAKKCDMFPNQMTYWKNGRSMPKTDKLVKIARHFDVPVETFIA